MIASIIIAAALLQPAGALILPRIDIPAALRATDCSNTEQRTALLAQVEQIMETARPTIQEMNQRLESRVEANVRRLVELGVWTTSDRTRFTMDLLNRPDFKAYLEGTQSVISDMMTSFETVASETSSEPARCEAILRMVGSLDRSVTAAETGWRAIDTAFAEEAQRLGVSLD